jgi:hypothetical protein
MASITPLGKPLSRNSVVGSNIPLANPGPLGGEQPISAFKWLSLVRATWTWILRPLWHLCFKWPVKLLIPTMSDAEDKRRSDEWDERRRQEQSEQESEAYWNSHR